MRSMHRRLWARRSGAWSSGRARVPGRAWLAAAAAVALPFTALLASCGGGAGGGGPTIASFAASPASVAVGGSSTLSWSVTGAASLTLDPGGTDVTHATSQVVSPAGTTTYTLTATNAGGSSTANATVTVQDSRSTSKTVHAADGGALTAGGVTLTIPASALEDDALVTLSVGAPAAVSPEDPLQPIGSAAAVDFGGVSLVAPASLALPATPVAGDNYVVTETSDANRADGGPATRVHAANPPGPLATQASPAFAVRVARAATYVLRVLPQPKEGTATTPLQVPFYWQAGYPWCSPTSTSMTLNYFQPLPGLTPSPEAPEGFVSNWYLASVLQQDATSGSWVGSFFENGGVPAELYSWLRWDADLIPSAAFTAYVALATTGAFGLAPKRPVLTTSDLISHAFVLTGVYSDGVFLHDGNARWSGTPPSLTWQQFRDQNAIGDKTDELGTMLVFGSPRPEVARRGSIELAPATAEDTSRTVVFRNPSTDRLSSWMWDANPYVHGYYFANDTGRPVLHSDAEFGYALPRSSRLETDFNIVNITDAALDYDVEARVSVGGASTASRTTTVAGLAGYSRSTVRFDFGLLSDRIGATGGPVVGRIDVTLRQGGVVQDVKTVSFRLVDDPTDAPQVSIDNAGTSIGTLPGVPITVEGSAYDAYALPNGVVPFDHLAWSDDGAAVGAGSSVVRSYPSPGQHTLTLTATGEYGVRASRAVTVNVRDPDRTPGSVLIDYPADRAVFAYYNSVEVNLVGHATDVSGTAVPDDRLFWTVDGSSAGTGSSTVALLFGHCNGSDHTVGLTARKGDGSPIGSRSITVTVIAPPC